MPQGANITVDRMDRTIPFELFIRLLKGALGKWSPGENLGLHPTDIPKLLRIASSRKKTRHLDMVGSLVKELDIPEINHRLIGKNLTPKRAEELLTVAKWILPAISMGGRRPVNYNCIISVPPGHGGSYFFEELFDLLEKMAPPDVVNLLKPEYGHLDNIAQRFGNVIMLDGLGAITGGRNISPSLSAVMVIVPDEEERAAEMLVTPTYYFDLDPLTKEDVVDIAIRNQIYYPGIDPDISEAVGFMLDSGITPKEILVSIELTRRSVPRYKHGDGEKPLDIEVFYLTAEKLGATRKIAVPLGKIEPMLKEKVFGQDSTIRDVSRHLGKSFYGLHNPKRPLLTALFVGPTGVGKTELARTLAEVYYGSSDKMIRLDMSEFSENHSVANLFGSPHGYVGHDSDTRFIMELKRHPHCLILFDEIEKASSRIHNALLQMLDDGRFTSARGETFDLTGHIIILTSNAESKSLGNTKLGFHPDAEKGFSPEETRAILGKAFPAEFLNRIDIVSTFKPLTGDAARKILIRELENTRANLLAKSVKFLYDNDLVDEILRIYDKNGGGRDLIRRVETVKSNAVNDLMEKKHVKEVKGRYKENTPSKGKRDDREKHSDADRDKRRSLFR